jgi:hypothetical protein
MFTECCSPVEDWRKQTHGQSRPTHAYGPLEEGPQDLLVDEPPESEQPPDGNVERGHLHHESDAEVGVLLEEAHAVAAPLLFLLHKCHTVGSQRERQCYTNVTQWAASGSVSVTQMSHRGQPAGASVLHKCHTVGSQRERQCYTNVAQWAASGSVSVTQMSHSGQPAGASVLHTCHTGGVRATHMSHGRRQSYTNVTREASELHTCHTGGVRATQMSHGRRQSYTNVTREASELHTCHMGGVGMSVSVTQCHATCLMSEGSWSIVKAGW